jgi:sialate O-acetylesterase
MIPACAQAAAPAEAPAMPFLHPLFSDNAVLQRDRPVPVWGWTKPGTSVVVKLGTKTTSVRAGADGKWMALVGPMPAGGPHEMSVAGAQVGEMARRANIVFGDVWICSGQSNMQWRLPWGVDNAAEETAAANFPLVRFATVPNVTAATPNATVPVAWQPVSPATVSNVSAIGYFFGRDLHRATNVSIGLIDSSWGGTIAEAWVSAPALERDAPEFKPAIATLAGPDIEVPFAQRMAAWWDKNDDGAREGFARADFADAVWQSATLPGLWERSGEAALAQFDGIVWYRREVEVPANMAGRDLTLQLGPVDDRDTTFWNGEEVGHTDRSDAAREYKIPGAKIKAGRNVLAVRVLDTGGGGGFGGAANALQLKGGADESLPLAGPWKMRVGKPFAELSPAPTNLVNNPNVPTVLYNAMIAPLVPYGVKGAIWYQGESNAGRGEQYTRVLPSLIRDWRGRFQSGDFPFYIVQLAGFMAPDEMPKSDAWPLLREAQNASAQIAGKSGVALAIDIGDEKDIHPRNKQEVARRLALLALAKDYGQKVDFEGPVLKSAARNNSTMVLTFSNSGGELSLKGEAERVFAIAGADKVFHWATPQVIGDTIVLTSPQVKEPVAARFGWSNLPRAFLYNKAGLPASPFRTDKW